MLKKSDFAVFGGGCFWCTEAIFASLRGVSSVTPGYAGGTADQPAYAEVCTGTTGHAEVVRVEFDPAVITYRDLLEVFFALHDPTTRNQQGEDVGEQYRSVIMYASNDQRRGAEAYIRELDAEKIFTKPVVTQVVPLQRFYPAEIYHQKYFEKNSDQPYCQFVISPKLAKLRQQFSAKLKPGAHASAVLADQRLLP